MVKISPSIASSSLLNVKEEIEFIDKHFNCIHLDIEDGNAVNSISFGFKLAKNICDTSLSSEKTIHLEVINPIKWIDKVKQCNSKCVFIQTDVLSNPLDILNTYKKENIVVGANISNLDMNKDYLNDVIGTSNYVLVNTTHHDDPTQTCDLKMLEFAKKLALTKKVFIDGGITWELYESICNSKIYSAVMGRGIFSDKQQAIVRYKRINEK